jgi:putative membrane protein
MLGEAHPAPEPSPYEEVNVMLVSWLLLTAAVAITAYILPGVTVSGFLAALVTALILGVVNMLVRPVLLLVTLPINLLTLGLFTFVVNAVCVLLVAAIVPGFKVRSFWWALAFSLVLAIINGVLQTIIY